MARTKKMDVKSNSSKKKSDNVADKKKTVVKKKTKKSESTKKATVSKKISEKKGIYKQKMNKGIKYFVLIVVLVLIFLFLRSSFALFNYTRTSGLNELVVGKIYMHYNSNTISLQGVIPRSTYDPDTYIEFSVDGLNEYAESDIWYAIDLLYGDIPTGLTSENRISDEFLRFRLTKQVDDGEEVEVINDATYENINNLRFYTELIPSDTSDELVHYYKLYVWVSDEIMIGNTEECNYSLSEWNDLFASIKVKVIGDFTPKGAASSVRVRFNADGGTVSEQFRYYSEGDVYGELRVATKEGYVFEGWKTADNVKVHANKELQYNQNHTLTAVYAVVKYRYVGEYTFDGTNYIDTGVNLFSETYAHSNFYISFDIVQLNSNNNSDATPISARQASGSKYGFTFSRTGTNAQFRMIGTGNASSYSRTNIYYGAQNIKIIRINDKMYYSLDDGGFTACGDFTNFSSYFNTPVTFGASLNSSGTPQNYFKGKLANMIIKIIIDDDISLDDFLYSTNKFEYDGDITFNGSTAINTGVYLFNRENATKSFYISFDIKSINWNVNRATLMSAKDETVSPWPGFELRRYGTNQTMESKATVSSTSAHPVTNIPKTTSNVRFLRVNNGVTNKLYYSLDGGNFIIHNDFTNFNLYFDVPVVFGNAFNVEVQRYFIGTLSNIVVKIIDDSEALEICGSACT